MYRVPLAEIKDKLIKSNKITPRELDERIKKKINDLSGLISEEGAAHILANELGVELFNSNSSRLKIKEVYAGMRDVTTLGKVVRKFDVREFAKGETKGKVCSIIVGDETGTIRVVFWNEQVEWLDKVNVDDVVLVKNAFARENNNDREIHMGNRGELELNPTGEIIGTVLKTQANPNFQRKKIEQLHDGEEGVEIFGTVVQVFDPRFFNVCPECGKKVVESEGSYACDEHKVVKPSTSFVLNAILDDGTGTIRGVFWKNQASRLLGKEETAIVGYKEDLSHFEEVKTDLLGEQFKLTGRVKRNEMFDRLELSVQLVEKGNAQEEIARLEKSNS
ncbi:MAG: OB-fold nucleic acid binding domain-containing protein [Candidatus Woesearchaeota archaeon]